jgi:hypothetical protein
MAIHASSPGGAVVSAVATTTALDLHLVGTCTEASCYDLGLRLHDQLRTGYETCAVLPVASLEQWRQEHRTARKRAMRAASLGYQFREVKREQYDEDIFAINTSLEERQGRLMSRGYRERQNYLPLPEYHCEHHAIRTYGVLDVRGTLVAYLWLYRSGELALVSSILGHGEHLANDVMFLLFQGAVERQADLGGFFVYNRADSGTDGLRYFKDKLGFEAMEVEWLL